MFAANSTQFKPPGNSPTYQVLGDLYTFYTTGVETGQTYALIGIQMQPHSGTPLHRHSREAESLPFPSTSMPGTRPWKFATTPTIRQSISTATLSGSMNCSRP